MTEHGKPSHLQRSRHRTWSKSERRKMAQVQGNRFRKDVKVTLPEIPFAKDKGKSK